MSRRIRGLSPHALAEHGHLKALKRRIRNGFDPMTIGTGWGWTVLGCAARYGHLKMVEYLLSLGIDGLVDHTGTSCQYAPYRDEPPYKSLATPLHVVCEMYRWSIYPRSNLGRATLKQMHIRHYRIAKLLIEHGADVHHMDITGSTPYSRALFAEERNHMILKLLEDHGCGVNDLLYGCPIQHIAFPLQWNYGCDGVDWAWVIVTETVERYLMDISIPLNIIRPLVESLGYYRQQKKSEYWDDEDDAVTLSFRERMSRYLLDHNKRIITKRKSSHLVSQEEKACW